MSFLSFVTGWFKAPLAEQSVDPLREMEETKTEAEAEDEFLNRYDEYLQKKPLNRDELSENMAYMQGYYWIPNDHPLAWALEQTHRKPVFEHKFKTPECGTCVVYAQEYVDSALEDIYQLYVAHGRMNKNE